MCSEPDLERGISEPVKSALIKGLLRSPVGEPNQRGQLSFIRRRRPLRSRLRNGEPRISRSKQRGHGKTTKSSVLRIVVFDGTVVGLKPTSPCRAVASQKVTRVPDDRVGHRPGRAKDTASVKVQKHGIHSSRIGGLRRRVPPGQRRSEGWVGVGPGVASLFHSVLLSNLVAMYGVLLILWLATV